ncbi:MAG: hypothetical protein HC844_11340, partial [Tabrizicola sp.]|nr:hypothetical protein [Tabrizicola sp.]
MTTPTDTAAPQAIEPQVNGHAPAMPGPEVLAKIQELRTQVRESFGQVVMAIMNPAHATGISRWA